MLVLCFILLLHFSDKLRYFHPPVLKQGNKIYEKLPVLLGERLSCYELGFLLCFSPVLPTFFLYLSWSTIKETFVFLPVLFDESVEVLCSLFSLFSWKTPHWLEFWPPMVHIPVDYFSASCYFVQGVHSNYHFHPVVYLQCYLHIHMFSSRVCVMNLSRTPRERNMIGML